MGEQGTSQQLPAYSKAERWQVAGAGGARGGAQAARVPRGAATQLLLHRMQGMKQVPGWGRDVGRRALTSSHGS